MPADEQTEPAPQAPAEPAAEKKKPARRSRRATAASGPAESAAPGETVGETAGTSDAPAVDAAGPDTAGAAATSEAAPAADGAATSGRTRPARRSRRATSAPQGDAPETAAPQDAVAPSATGAETTAAAQDAAGAAADATPSRSTRPGTTATTGSGDKPRLATTALLFQAPDPAAAPRRPRRAQSPAGPPRHHDAAPADAGRTSETPAPTGTPADAGKASATRDAAPAATPDAATPDTATVGTTESAAKTVATGKPVATDVVLTGEDRAAVEEIELIESELVAEGVDLPDDEFGPQDFAEVEDAVEPGDEGAPRRRRRRGGRGRRGRPDNGRDSGADDAPEGQDAAADPAAEDETPADAEAEATEQAEPAEGENGEESGSSRRRRRRRRGGRGEPGEGSSSRQRPRERSLSDEVTALKGSTRLEAKRQRRREGRDAGRRRQIITEAEFLARREAVERAMVVRETGGRTQIAVLEDGVLVEHYVSQQSQASMAGNVYLGRVQNVLPSMEAAFIDVGKGRNAVLYAGEVNWDAVGLEGQPRRIEQALKSGDTVLVQVTKDPIGHKGARLTSQITLAGRYLVYVPGGGMTGISRKLPDTERNRLKKILKEVVPDGAGVIVRTAAEGASEDELRADVERLRGQWETIEKKAKGASAPALLQGEPDLAIRVVRDIFNDDFSSLVVQGDSAWGEISSYVEELAPDLRERVSRWTGTNDVFTVHRVDEQLAKGMDRKVWLPSGGSLVIDRTEAMTVVDVNTGKFTGSGGTLEETVTRNNLEAAEEIVRQLRLRDIGGIIVIDFIDMVLESNRDLVLRRLVECLGRDRTKHQVAEVTSLGLVQMTRKRVGQGLVEAFSETCEHCHGRGFIVHTDPVERSGGNGQGNGGGSSDDGGESKRSRRKRGGSGSGGAGGASSSGASKDAITLPHAGVPVLPEVSSQAREAVKATLATIAAAAAHAHEHEHGHEHADQGAPGPDSTTGAPEGEE
ncbi:Rne/Rng family ribonuclease [Cellulosimicrobium marinum]|nr:Rne/Rng family ribonuclease [Cellulosimicrobium marinum]